MSLDQVSSTANDVATVNELFRATKPASLFGIKGSTTVALTLGIYGGMFWTGSALSELADTTVTLTASQTNYVEATTAGVVSANTSGFTAGRIKLYVITTSAAGISGITDYRTTRFAGSAFDHITIASGTLTDSNPALSITQTWNDAADTFVAVDMNITDTASAAASLLLRLRVGGVEKLSVDKAGTLTITTNGPKFTFYEDDVGINDAYLKLANLTGGAGVFVPFLQMRSNHTGNFSGSTIVGDVITDTSSEAASACLVLSSRTNNSTVTNRPLLSIQNLTTNAITVRADGTTLISTFATALTIGQANKLQVNGNATTLGGISLSHFSASAVGPRLEFSKSRSGTTGTNTIAQDGDVLGQINAYGADGTNYDLAAQILFEVNGTPGAGTDMPGRIRDLCSPDGSATPTEVLRRAAVASAVNYISLINAATGAGASINAAGSDTDIDLPLNPKGTGVLRFGTRTAIGAETITGYITIKDSGGTSRKIAVVS